MLARGDVIAKRQGYTPEQRSCGTGRTCQDACGASYVQCPSTDSRIHCHNPTTGSHCCTDGTGNACRAGFYCTTDGRGNTYCCPDDIQNAECARLYSLTVSLMRETSLTARPTTSTPRFSVTALTPVLSIPSSRIHVTSTRSSVRSTTVAPSSRATTSAIRSASRNATSLVLPSSKFNATSTQSTVPLFTGGAMKVAGAGMAVLAGAAGLLL
ncbi:hypothetical protein CC86DRAFT_278157 [Ophiobolus disseminans]|uniref:Uncharacterized protein n=1 Tax=Ophiobolus disseminans TaxID=1469910 RepID=A0A6A7ALP8_9PLEO|nr:hypothetical protein CC86DRAFT_278157 [Ophiobolus disseminans]